LQAITPEPNEFKFTWAYISYFANRQMMDFRENKPIDFLFALLSGTLLIVNAVKKTLHDYCTNEKWSPASI